MTLNISITADVAAKLRKGAAAVGKDVPTFVREAVEEKLTQDRTLRELLAPVHAAFRRSGMSQERAMQAFEHARHETWKAKRRKRSKAS